MNVCLATIHLLGWLSLAEFFGSWHSVLWIGMAVLVVAEVILSRTRWSESRPLALCITLSVCAHLVLIVYAYGARMGGPGGGQAGFGNGETIVALNLQMDETSSADVGVPDDFPPPESESSATSSKEPKPDDGPTQDAANSTEASPVDRAAEPTETDPPGLADTDAPTKIGERHQLTAADLTIDMPPPDDATSIADADRAELVGAANRLAQAALDAAPEIEAQAARARLQEVAHISSERPHADEPRGEPRRRADHQPVPRVYQNRISTNRPGLVLQFGGSPDTEAAVSAAHGWLVVNQAADGRWDADAHGAGREARILGQDRGGAGARADTGITGLAVLALLAAGHTHLDGEHRESVQHGLEFLLRSQRSDGNLAGEAELFARLYCQGIATLALSEAYAMTGDQRLRPYVERAVACTIASQHPSTGGWRYQPGETGDMSQFGWQLLALKSAELAGFEIPATTRSGMERFLDSVTSGRDRGLASYRPREQPSRTMTAEALLCRFFLQRYSEPQIAEASAYLLEETPGRGQINFYYWYYATLALHQAQGPAWRTWNDRLTARLLSSQRTNGPQAGSWDPDPVWGNYGGRVFSTALGALCLESYYRYLPLSDRTAPTRGK